MNNGILYLTNFTNEDFVTSWDGKEYTFPAGKRTPVVIGSPLENQEIRKLFAKKLCEREIFAGKDWLKNEKASRKDGNVYGGPYQEQELAELMQKCLGDAEPGELSIQDKRTDQTGKFDKLVPIDEVEKTGALNGVN